MVERTRNLNPDLWGIYAEASSVKSSRFQEVAGTSLDALPKALERHRTIELQIMKLCKDRALTTYELSQALNRPVNCVTQPVQTLRRKGLIVLAGLKQNPTGAQACAWTTRENKQNGNTTNR